ncbi:MAG: 16S rRNA (adenine(1518)-N(6)/adenine(1519)-N(6))-dimethyltransferase RsmA [Endomicrobium sp.]|jgi:16S rRNA (adenine1518-N6/adenine1519-N6)-dimethyltransferase|nr:16S rRNA (adenine(1518)-N(6)/adenine(1519)-N(6))-dimethyltransferase RsmA [Endomicrobium sp.]
MRQRYGQNFLIDNNIANNIVNVANLKEQDKVLEIGPGKGILTKIIQPRVKQLIAVEIDSALFYQLYYYFLFLNIKNVEIINKDFLKYDLMSLCPNIIKNLHKQENNFKIISNLPYATGTAIIQKILPFKNWDAAVFMLQKEVAQRLVAQPCSGKNYGYISVFISYYTNSKILFDVSPKCFNPRPKVVSSVVKLINKKPKYPELIFFDLVKHIFSMRRKTILNGLSSFRSLGRERSEKILKSCKLDIFLRADNLSTLDFILLTKKMQEYKIHHV